MKRKIIGILDHEEGYAARLMEVFNSKSRMGFQAELFTNTAAFLEYSRKHTVEILLIGESLMEQVLKSAASMVIIISEGIRVAELDEFPTVYKYQSSELIIRDVLECYAKNGRRPEQLCGNTMKLYGIYAPQGRDCKSAFAWNLARHLGRNESVLYLSLTAFGYKRELYEKEKDLADIMYYVRHGFDNLIYLVGSLVVRCEEIDCLPPVRAIEDLIHVPGDDWLKILQVIRNQSHYEAVVIDIEECVQQFYRVLDYCDEVYIPYEENHQNTVRWELCEQYFKKMEAEDVWKKAKKLSVDPACGRIDMNSIIQS